MKLSSQPATFSTFISESTGSCSSSSSSLGSSVEASLNAYNTKLSTSPQYPLATFPLRLTVISSSFSRINSSVVNVVQLSQPVVSTLIFSPEISTFIPDVLVAPSASNSSLYEPEGRLSIVCESVSSTASSLLFQ